MIIIFGPMNANGGFRCNCWVHARGGLWSVGHITPKRVLTIGVGKSVFKHTVVVTNHSG